MSKMAGLVKSGSDESQNKELCECLDEDLIDSDDLELSEDGDENEKKHYWV